MKPSFMLLVLALLVVACNPKNVEFDNNSPSFVDKDTGVGIDSGLPQTSAGDEIVNESNDSFVPPPADENITVDGDTQSADIPPQLRERNLVTLWVWNEYGAQKLLVSEGTGVGVPRLKVTVEVPTVSAEDGGKAAISVNGKPARIMKEREETAFGDTYVFVRDIIAQ